ncbi:MAG: MOSC domain-containing protein [Burkholderiales bacterium]|nr:MOSC domain-containing protein [Burkholderiales bacterium]MDP2398654.1 MOSC domain-containing protein [Burkholderiales bacterium]
MPKLNPESPLRALMEIFPHAGKLEWIGLRPAKRAPLQSFGHVEVIADHGLAGDHKATRAGGKRQVTLIQREHIEAIAKLLGREAVDPTLLRRNLVVSGINLLALRGERFRIGEVLFESTGLCEPCSRMEEVLGAGGYNAMRGHGGITAQVLNGGMIAAGDAVVYQPPGNQQQVG